MSRADTGNTSRLQGGRGQGQQGGNTLGSIFLVPTGGWTANDFVMIEQGDEGVPGEVRAAWQ